MLAWQLKTEESNRIVSSVEETTGRISNNPSEINDAFKKYYRGLYTAQPSNDMSAIDSFHPPINLLSLSNELSESMSKPFKYLN